MTNSSALTDVDIRGGWYTRLCGSIDVLQADIHATPYVETVSPCCVDDPEDCNCLIGIRLLQSEWGVDSHTARHPEDAVEMTVICLAPNWKCR